MHFFISLAFTLGLCLVHGTDGGRFGTFVQRLRTTSLFLGNSNWNSLSGIFATAPKEAFMRTPELILHHGRQVEKHTVTTDDGYILTLFRVLPGQGSKVTKDETKREPVVLWHGTMASSDSWLLVPRSQDNLPYLLVDNGHDVWLANSRGNEYSKGHLNGIRSEDPKFYDFSQDDIGRFDVYGVIRYILKMTGAPKLSGICHSMGCNVISMAMLEWPELNGLVHKLTFLAPANYMTDIKNPFFKIFYNIPGSTLQALADFVGGGRVIPSEVTRIVKEYGPHMCVGSLRKEICAQIINSFFGFNDGQATEVTAGMMVGHQLSDSSMKCMVHTGQLIGANKFQKFDFGVLNNMRMYKTSTPPVYNLSNIIVPVQGFYGVNDVITSPQDVLKTLDELENVQEKIKVNHTAWTHLDYFYSKDAKIIVYDPILKFLALP